MRRDTFRNRTGCICELVYHCNDPRFTESQARANSRTAPAQVFLVRSWRSSKSTILRMSELSWSVSSFLKGFWRQHTFPVRSRCKALDHVAQKGALCQRQLRSQSSFVTRLITVNVCTRLRSLDTAEVLVPLKADASEPGTVCEKSHFALEPLFCRTCPSFLQGVDLLASASVNSVGISALPWRSSLLCMS